MRIILLLSIIVIMSVPTVLLEGEDDSDLFTFVRLKYSGQLHTTQQLAGGLASLGSEFYLAAQ